MELETFEPNNEHVANTPRARAVQASEVLLECRSGLQKDANNAVTRGCRRSLGVTVSSAEPCMVRRLAAQVIMTTGRFRIRIIPSLCNRSILFSCASAPVKGRAQRQLLQLDAIGILSSLRVSTVGLHTTPLFGGRQGRATDKTPY